MGSGGGMLGQTYYFYPMNFKYKRKKIWLTTDKTKYCTVLLFNTRKEMREYFSEYCKRTNQRDYDNILGASLHFEKYINGNITKETGKVLLSLQDCGAGVVSHELLHATLWAYKHRRNKKRYPFIIKSHNEEERVLQNHTYAVKQFYNWYWKVVK